MIKIFWFIQIIINCCCLNENYAMVKRFKFYRFVVYFVLPTRSTSRSWAILVRELPRAEESTASCSRTLGSLGEGSREREQCLSRERKYTNTVENLKTFSISHKACRPGNTCVRYHDLTGINRTLCVQRWLICMKITSGDLATLSLDFDT